MRLFFSIDIVVDSVKTPSMVIVFDASGWPTAGMAKGFLLSSIVLV